MTGRGSSAAEARWWRPATQHEAHMKAAQREARVKAARNEATMAASETNPRPSLCPGCSWNLLDLIATEMLKARPSGGSLQQQLDAAGQGGSTKESSSNSKTHEAEAKPATAAHGHSDFGDSQQWLPEATCKGCFGSVPGVTRWRRLEARATCSGS
ncbi:hypothetical protein CFC21_052229 [Triticum aestivum]|uniref:Uncharacterized protein n=3 Tax=Triticum TaxID=4564 RepID=A0A9R0VYU1_TRITD|nr:hypothetical protein CFC21_052229 [Triticum aestivum]VAH90967.1 unnamed protein product [Triticum turgidum subsp. durum]